MRDFRPYSGIRILDCCHELGSYATRLFADLGAEVIRIEPPGGAADRRRFESEADGLDRRGAYFSFVFRNASKSSVTLDPDEEGGRERMDRYVRSAQVVFLERDGLFANEMDWICSLNPAAVVVFVSPYGMDGPCSHWQSNDLVLQAAGGMAWLSGRPDDPPLRLPVDQSAMITSVYAAAAAAVALFDAEATGAGHLIDVSGQECIAHSLQNAIQVYDLEQRISHRSGEGTRDATEDIFQCRDGRVFLASSLSLGPAWHSLVAWMKEVNHPAAEVLSQSCWLDVRWRKTRQAKQQFRAAFADFISAYSKQEILAHALQRKLVMSPVSRISDLFDDEQLAHRNYFVTLDGNSAEGPFVFPGAPYKLSEPVWAVAPPPAQSERSEASMSPPDAVAN
jgi:benzylsuccinate CoA-transferase BbsE subunit